MRATWTDSRLDDLATHTDRRFDDGTIHALSVKTEVPG